MAVPAKIGEGALARRFFAGQYADIVAATYDAPGTRLRDGDVAFVVGALTFVGRLDDAQACHDGWRQRTPQPPARSAAACRFFLSVAYGRAGRFAAAHELVLRSLREHRRDPDAWVVALVFQSLAMLRYFTGRYRAAAQHTLHALRAAHLAGFAYAQMLATDLRGHALLQLGHFHAGVGLLEQAQGYAERLGFGLNAFSIECSLAVYHSRFSTGVEGLRRLERLLAVGTAHDSYSLRALRTEAAIQYALRGQADQARVELEHADHEALRMDARRAKVTSLLARLYLARCADGVDACATLVEQAEELLDEQDVAFRAELLGFAVWVEHVRDRAAPRERALGALRALVGGRESYRARAVLEQYAAGPGRTPAFLEDEVTPLLRAVVARDERILPRLLALGLLGLVPELLGRAPGRRVSVLGGENALLIEDHGNLWLRPRPPRWAPALLTLLASGAASKEAIVSSLWGLRYSAERHDPLIRTTIHRLRGLLEPRGEWITVTAAGYGLSVPVERLGDAGIDGDALAMPEPVPEDVGLELPPAPSRGAGAGTAAARAPLRSRRPGHEAAVLHRLQTLGNASIPELARGLSLSESTILRALRSLMRSRQVQRTGAARATRYRPR